MYYFTQLFLMLLKIDQEMILSWFGIKRVDQQTSLSSFDEQNFTSEFITNLDVLSKDVDPQIFQIIFRNLWAKLNMGLSLTDIETSLFFILFIRLIILAVRYNLKTSVYITGIGLVAGYLWYRHLIDLLSMYRNTLLNVPFLENLGLDALRLREYHYQMAINDKNFGANIHWYDIGSLIYYAFIKGIIDINSETGFSSYIDPLSMAISNLDGITKTTITPIYYKVYNQILPRIFLACSNFWSQLSGIAAYALITRIGKRYCPYLVRWHWTFILVISLFEPFLEYFVFRAEYFEAFVLIPQLILSNSASNSSEIASAVEILNSSHQSLSDITSYSYENTLFQITLLNTFVNMIIITHITLIILALFHAIWGQYFYLPFITKNVELHIGPRPKTSIYSGGCTSWQEIDSNPYSVTNTFPKLWYGWFGRGTAEDNLFVTTLQIIFSRVIRKIRQFFR